MNQIQSLHIVLLMFQVDGTGTVATDDRFQKSKEEPSNKPEESSQANGLVTDDAGPINEDLFMDEDLEGLDDELNDLDLN